MANLMKQLVKKTLNQFGLDVVRVTRSPRQTLLGLRDLPIRSVIDVGANRGQFAHYISRIFPDAHIYCFEPLPEPFEALRQWADRRRGKATLFNVALGDCEGTVKIFRHLDHDASSSFLSSTALCHALYPFTAKQTPVSVQLTTLDGAIGRLPASPSPETLIKLDVQGYEDRVIRGGTETFQKAKACVVEVCRDVLYDNQATFKDLLLLLDSFGYRYSGNLEQSYAHDGHVIFFDAVFSK